MSVPLYDFLSPDKKYGHINYLMYQKQPLASVSITTKF